MTRPGLVALSLLFISCGNRAPPVIDGSTRADGVSTDRARPGDLGAFCSGASKASINGSTLTVEQVTGQDYISAAHTEGARVQLIAAGLGPPPTAPSLRPRTKRCSRPPPCSASTGGASSSQSSPYDGAATSSPI